MVGGGSCCGGGVVGRGGVDGVLTLLDVDAGGNSKEDALGRAVLTGGQELALALGDVEDAEE